MITIKPRPTILVALISLAMPMTADAAPVKTLHIEIGYPGVAAAFNLYKDGKLACTTPGTEAAQIDCPVEIDPTPMTFVLTAVDREGTESPQSAPYVLMPPAIPTAAFTATPPAKIAPAPVSFDASDSYDFDGMIVRYLWDFGDGTSGTGQFIDHTYPLPGTYLAQLTVVDDDYHSAKMTMPITIATPAPVAKSQALTLLEDHPLAGRVSATNATPAPLAYTIVTRPQHGALSLFNASTGTFTYTPHANFYGADRFTFTASNGVKKSAVTTVILTVKPVNDSPKATNDFIRVKAGTSSTIPVRANDTDVDRDPLTLVSLTQPKLGQAKIVNGSILFIAPTLTGKTIFPYRISDGRGGTATGLVTVTVLP